ncbi:glycosyltransferase family 4 protein [Nocardioides humilatus]|uniref:Glycosyltransferase family 4 protein n=1 Tax=Nocardioides humilatus TaxID=2607660 RepID=A0A5B1LIQ6_9ACTN|nr:glycosyltransferase family 4 protein [Nocardioides humilatus]KAA1420274.1 glycosyltransferase family 4 protein [Nocardioides humilatus]
MSPGGTVHFVVPEGIDDPHRPSGGNRYDRRVIDALRDRGWTVAEHHEPVRAERVIVDGLLAVRDPDAWGGAIVLLHMPFAEAYPELEDAERRLLRAARTIVTTSEWSRGWVITHHDLDPPRVIVAPPGVDPAPRATPSVGGGRLLSVGPVSRLKGHDVLVAALGQLDDLEWTCTWVGARDVDDKGADRITYTGPLPAPPYSDADLLVSASRHEAYGMAVTEALAQGVPAVVTDVGGHPEALGGGGLLLPADDPDTLAKELRRWLTDPDARADLRAAAARRRASLRSWDDTARDLEAVLR